MVAAAQRLSIRREERYFLTGLLGVYVELGGPMNTSSLRNTMLSEHA
jgi:hypothetical protein